LFYAHLYEMGRLMWQY